MQFFIFLGYDVDDLERQVDEELKSEQVEEPDLMDLDLENMEPLELQQRLKNPKFKATLEQLGVDVEELEQQVNEEIKKQQQEEVVIEDEKMNEFPQNDEDDDNQPLDENLQEIDPKKNPY